MSDHSDQQNLESMIQEAGGAVNLLRRGVLGQFRPPGYQAEFTNWREEQRAWTTGVALLEQSYHMPELHLRGSEVIPFLKEFTVNKYDPFPVMRAKQLVSAGPDGNLISDAIIFREEEDFFRVVGDPAWLQFNLEKSSYDITQKLFPNWFGTHYPRDVYRFQLQGPHALSLMSDLVQGELPDVKFFHIAELEIAGRSVRALRHGMAGTPGFEIYGPWEEKEQVIAAVEVAGRKYDLKKVGAAAYPTTSQESGWMPVPLPAIYSSPELKEFREWLEGNSMYAIGFLGGSMTSTNIEDYYIDPIEAGYGSFIDWGRDFIGSGPLKLKAESPRRRKVTLVWNDDDVADVIASSLFDVDDRAQWVTFPMPHNGFYVSDIVRTGSGEQVGVSQWSSFSERARHVISTAIIDLEHAEPGTELELVWGNPDVSSAFSDARATHVIRATVAPSPYFSKDIKSEK